MSDASCETSPAALPRLALVASGMTLLGGCDGDGQMTWSLVAMLAALNLVNASVLIKMIKHSRNRFDEFVKGKIEYYERAAATMDLQHANFGMAVVFGLLGSLAVTNPDLPFLMHWMGVAPLLLALPAQALMDWYDKRKFAALETENRQKMAKLEFDFTNATQPERQIEVLLAGLEDRKNWHPTRVDEMPLFRTESFKNPKTRAAVMTGEKGVLKTDAFAESAVVDKLKILEFYQDRALQTLDAEIIHAYLETLRAAMLADATLGKKAYPLVRQLMVAKLAMNDPESPANRKDPALALELQKLVTGFLFRMHRDDVGATRKCLANHFSDIAIFFASHAADADGEAKILAWYDAQLAAARTHSEDIPVGQLATRLANEADLTPLFTEVLPRFNGTQQAAVIGGAIRLILDMRDGARLSRFMTDAEIFLPRDFWQTYGADMGAILDAAETAVFPGLDAGVGQARHVIAQMMARQPQKKNDSADEQTRLIDAARKHAASVAAATGVVKS